MKRGFTARTQRAVSLWVFHLLGEQLQSPQLEKSLFCTHCECQEDSSLPLPRKTHSQKPTYRQNLWQVRSIEDISCFFFLLGLNREYHFFFRLRLRGMGSPHTHDLDIVPPTPNARFSGTFQCRLALNTWGQLAFWTCLGKVCGTVPDLLLWLRLSSTQANLPTPLHCRSLVFIKILLYPCVFVYDLVGTK